ncbi:hypothetical protein L3556_02690 [Candidatus Synechococcus calcipolaris G9]|uniref:Uncharacterized protein n=1 Tax=Candidatus Synechococcus calcipolaris G9 TaxID=1497997 RepID=A0ABT6EVL9_9SYNE|nr:hypothetical protein [Candidatus Synechococcus calcipolaris]MDG2989846.1 hypothetical protein [Candidatus Synechococcus calcipolaris G9]
MGGSPLRLGGPGGEHFGLGGGGASPMVADAWGVAMGLRCDWGIDGAVLG